MDLNKNYIDKIKKLYMFNKSDKLNNLDEILNKNIKKYNLYNITLLNNLNYNIILDAFLPKYGNVIVKILMDDKLGYHEIEMLKLYNGNFACKLLEANYIDNFYILEKIIPGSKLSLANNFNYRTKIICDLIKKLIIPYYKEKTNIPFYTDILHDAFLYIRDNKKLDNLNLHIIKCKEVYNYIKSLNFSLYYLHNDIHSHNVLKSKYGYIAIDPHGVIGECLFEYAPYIINEIWDSNYDENLFINIIKTVSKYSNETVFNLTCATYTHLCMSTIWFIQDECDDRLFNKNIKILNFLYKNIDIPK